jgi:hypothetical protein
VASTYEFRFLDSSRKSGLKLTRICFKGECQAEQGLTEKALQLLNGKKLRKVKKYRSNKIAVEESIDDVTFVLSCSLAAELDCPS